MMGQAVSASAMIDDQGTYSFSLKSLEVKFVFIMLILECYLVSDGH